MTNGNEFFFTAISNSMNMKKITGILARHYAHEIYIPCFVYYNAMVLFINASVLLF